MDQASGGTVSACVRRGRMCFLSKDLKDDENPAALVRSPDKTRPLTLANAGAKLLSDAFSIGLQRAAPTVIGPIQRAGVAR
eukprot:6009417-Pyramimonas_sp.AAC.1